MQKSRPLGVTIIAIWALVGSGVVIIYAITFVIFQEPHFDADFVTYFSMAFSTAGDLVVVPLGSPVLGGLAAPASGYYLISKISLAFLYALIGFLTFRGSKFAWLGNVAISIAGVVSAVLLLYYLFLQEINVPSLSNGAYGQFFTLTVMLYSIYLAVAALRLFYLFKAHVRDFFGTKSLFSKTHTT